MRVTRLRLRDFRSYAAADVRLGAGLTVVHGPQRRRQDEPARGALLRLHRALVPDANEREVRALRRGAARWSCDGARRATAGTQSRVGFQPGEPKRLRVDGAPVERLADVAGAPARVASSCPTASSSSRARRRCAAAHLDQVVAALWPARARHAPRLRRARWRSATRCSPRVRAGRAARASLPAWDAELARHGVALSDDRAGGRRAAAPALRRAGRRARASTGDAELRYRPRSRPTRPRRWPPSWPSASTATSSAASPATARTATTSCSARDGRELRAYGSQGEQRLALLALLLAEREVLAAERGAPPLLLLDDVMSELDADRRERLVALLRARRPELITTTDLAHVPGRRPDVARDVADGVVRAASGEAVGGRSGAA